MENASKALIIAGAILIAILLITIGIVLINQGRGVTDRGTAAMQSQAIQTFNAQFTPYEGTQKGSQLRSLFNTVNASNATDETHHVDIDGVVTTAADLVYTKDYKVELEYSKTGSEVSNTEKGYIYKVNITE